MTNFASSIMHPLDFNEWWGALGRRGNPSHVPLLRLIADEDANLKALEVNGQKVAHFPYRQKASILIAAITGQPAHYRGLQGEDIRSGHTPQKPYPEQTRVVAAWLLNRLQRELAGGTLRWMEARPHEHILLYLRGHGLHEVNRELCDEFQFGPSLEQALKAQAAEQKLLERVQELRSFYPWNPGSFGE